ncbi:hypothetical protein BDQ17DRAFT_1335669 [Cyathus striatus]|nr:hypothetical protein BDQ17DRAFT_1335669 [Cyathus striatus]
MALVIEMLVQITEVFSSEKQCVIVTGMLDNSNIEIKLWPWWYPDHLYALSLHLGYKYMMTCYPLDENGKSETSSVVVLIPKPKGEAGKMYKLVDHVQCSPEQLSDIETCISVIVKEVLDFSCTYPTQEQSKLTTICKKAANQYPDLLKYDNNWITLDIIKIILQNHRKDCQKSTTTTKEVGTGLKKARAVCFAGS